MVIVEIKFIIVLCIKENWSNGRCWKCLPGLITHFPLEKLAAEDKLKVLAKIKQDS